MTKVVLLLALVLGVYAPSLASASGYTGCDLERAASAEQAQVKRTCVYADGRAKSIQRSAKRHHVALGYRVLVHSNACRQVGSVAQCSYRLFFSPAARGYRASCTGLISLRPRSSDPAQLVVKSLGMSCVT